jgi:hypothetical protein
MRGLFAHLALRWRAQGLITTAEAKALLRTMRAHRHALISGDATPMVPRLITRRFRPTLLFAVFRVSVEQSGVFVLGLFAVPAAIVIGIYRLLANVARWAAPHLSNYF